MKKATIEFKVLTGFLISLLIIVIFSISTFFSMRKLIKENRDLQMTQEAVKSISELEYDLVQIESSGRAFALSGSEKSKETYQLAIRDGSTHIAKLEALMHKDKNYQAEKEKLDRSFVQLISYSDMVIEARHKQGVTAALELLLNGKVAKYENSIMMSIQNIEESCRIKLVGATKNNISAANNTIRYFSMLVFVVLIVLAAVYYLMKRDMKARRELLDHLSKLNGDLESRIRIRTEALIKNEKKYRLLADNALDVISLHAMDGSYIYVSESIKKMVGYEPDEIIGKSGYEYTHPDDIPFIREIHQTLLTSNPHTGTIPLRFRKKDGTYLDVESLVNVIYDVNGNFESTMVCTRDVSERVRTEQALKDHQKQAQKETLDSQAKLRAILHNSIDPIWSIGKDFTLVDFNESCKYMADYFFGSAIAVGISPIEMFDAASAQEWRDCYLRTLSGEYFSKEMKLVHRMEDYYYDVSFNPITVNEQIEGVAVFARDVTSHKKIEKQLSYKVNELNTFMYKATHDLRSPLVSLIGLVHLAQTESGVNPELKQYFGMIDKSVNKMDKLLVDLVSITNVSQGKVTSSRIDFDKMVSDIMESLKHHPGFDSIKIHKRIAENLLLHSDEKLLYSVMQNLIDNAIKYRKTNNGFDSKIMIDIEPANNSVLINVSDNGIGIPAKSQDKVFDMFYRATSNAVGTGLGLYIVKSAVEKMGGKISLNSQESGGTSIYIALPDLSV